MPSAQGHCFLLDRQHHLSRLQVLGLVARQLSCSQTRSWWLTIYPLYRSNARNIDQRAPQRCCADIPFNRPPYIVAHYKGQSRHTSCPLRYSLELVWVCLHSLKPCHQGISRSELHERLPLSNSGSWLALPALILLFAHTMWLSVFTHNSYSTPFWVLPCGDVWGLEPRVGCPSTLERIKLPSLVVGTSSSAAKPLP